MRRTSQGNPMLLTIFFLFAMLLAACAEPPPAESVVVQLNWQHYGAFGGFYAAERNGDYAEEDLAVTFLEGGIGIDPVAAVVNGDAQFGVTSANTLLLARAEGNPVQAIATVHRRSPDVLVAPAGSGITRPADLAGLKIRMTDQIAPSFRAMMARAGLSPGQYEEVTLPSDPALFPSDEVPVWGVYFNSFAVTLQHEGHDLHFIFPEDYGVHAYGDTIFTTDGLVESDPALVTRFLRATLRGWQFAIENPSAAGAMAAAYKDDADPSLESAKMEASVPLIHTGSDQIGWMRPDRWQKIHETLLQQGVLSAPVDIDSLYTMEFLHTIYGEQP